MAKKKRVLFFGFLALLLAFSHAPADEADAGAPPPDPYAVPDGDPEQLLEFIETLLASPPVDDQSREKTLAALNEAFDRLLAGKATDEQVEAVVHLKMNLFRGQPEQLSGLTEKLLRAGREPLARQVKGSLLVAQLRAAMRRPRDEALPDIEKAVGQVIEFLEAGPFAASDVQLGMMAAQVAEMAGSDERALDVYRKLQQLTAGSDDPRLESIAKTLGGVVRRMTLTGNSMEIQGTTLAGEPFDWSKYDGKTVLVTFWATWCGPCIREIPTLARLYEAYHEKGFDIVAISLDRGRGPLEEFVRDRELPWTILFEEDEPRNPVAEHYGVTGIPQMFLVGSDGKVVSTQARGRVLEALLSERFGPPEDSPEDE